MGIKYDTGAGVAKDQVQAVAWYRKAAEQGIPQAQDNLGLCYANGEVVAKDLVQAVSWFRKAAEQGFAPAQLNLGVSYYAGYGVAKDEIEAYAYWNLAAIAIESARKKLTILEKSMPQDARLLGQRRARELQKEIDSNIAAKKAGK